MTLVSNDTSLALALPVNPSTAVSFGIGRIGRIGMDRNGSRWSPHHSDLLRSAIIPILPIFSDPPNIPMSDPPVS